MNHQPWIASHLLGLSCKRALFSGARHGRIGLPKGLIPMVTLAPIQNDSIRGLLCKRADRCVSFAKQHYFVCLNWLVSNLMVFILIVFKVKVFLMYRQLLNKMALGHLGPCNQMYCEERTKCIVMTEPTVLWWKAVQCIVMKGRINLCKRVCEYQDYFVMYTVYLSFKHTCSLVQFHCC